MDLEIFLKVYFLLSLFFIIGLIGSNVVQQKERFDLIDRVSYLENENSRLKEELKVSQHSCFIASGIYDDLIKKILKKLNNIERGK